MADNDNPQSPTTMEAGRAELDLSTARLCNIRAGAFDAVDEITFIHSDPETGEVVSYSRLHPQQAMMMVKDILAFVDLLGKRMMLRQGLIAEAAQQPARRGRKNGTKRPAPRKDDK